MELNHIEATVLHNFPYCGRCFIDKDADCLYKGRNGTDYLTHLLGRNFPGAGGKDETKGVGTEFDRNRRVLQIGYAANFYFYFIHFAFYRR